MTDRGDGDGQSDDAVADLGANYDDAPNETYCHPRSAPARRAAIAYVFGLDSPEVSTARVLEIGCAGAGNLIPLAATHPAPRSVGIDLSQVQIAQRRQRIRALELTTSTSPSATSREWISPRSGKPPSSSAGTD